MASQPAISIITPAYNASKHLKVAMQSLQDQTFKDFEVIIVEDCSPDGGSTLLEAERLAKLDSRIRVARTASNFGASKARNIGLDMACGDYVTFLDADDQLCPDALEEMYNLATRYNADVICCTMESIFPDGSIRNHIEGSTEQVFTNPAEITEIALNVFSESVGRGRRVFHMPTISRLIRRSLLNNNSIRFPDVCHMLGEDIPPMFASMQRCRVFVYTANSYYRYLQHPDSTTHTIDSELISKTIESSRYFADMIRREPDLPMYAVHNAWGFALTGLRTSLKQMFTAPGSLKSKRKWMQQQADNPFFATIYHEYPWREMPIKHRLGFICFYKKHFLPLYVMVVGQEKVRKFFGKA